MSIAAQHTGKSATCSSLTHSIVWEHSASIGTRDLTNKLVSHKLDLETVVMTFFESVSGSLHNSRFMLECTHHNCLF